MDSNSNDDDDEGEESEDNNNINNKNDNNNNIEIAVLQHVTRPDALTNTANSAKKGTTPTMLQPSLCTRNFTTLYSTLSLEAVLPTGSTAPSLPTKYAST